MSINAKLIIPRKSLNSGIEDIMQDTVREKKKEDEIKMDFFELEK